MRSVIYTAVFILLLIPAVLFAAEETGGVENVFAYGAGLRALGMGGAFTAMEGDSSLTYWNPGAMAFNQYKEVSLFGTRTIADSYYFSGFYTNPTMSLGTIGIGGLGVTTGGIESYDEYASPITSASSNYFHYQLLIGYGYNFRWGLGLGGSVKIEQMRITEYKGAGMSFDLGAYYSFKRLPWLSVGAVVQDVWGTGIKIADEFEKNTRIYKAGAASTFLLGKAQTTRLTLAFDTRFYTDNYNPDPGSLLHDMSLGAELAFSEQLMFRTGYRYFTFSSLFSDLPQGISLGMTVKRWGFGLDYAVTFEDSDWQGPAELLMRVGLSYRFGKSIDEKKREQAEAIRSQIDDGIREATQDYEQQLEDLSAEYEKEQEQLLQDLETSYQKKLESVDETIEDARQEIIADLSAQFEADKQKTLEELADQYEDDRETLERRLIDERSDYEEQMETLQRQFEEEKVTIREQTSADETFKSENYAKGLQLYSDGKYEDALAAFEAVSAADENYLNVKEYMARSRAEMKDVGSYDKEILDFYYAGIDLFVQKRYKDAITEWEKILEIDPYNKLAIRNIKEAEDRLRKLEELGIEE